MHTSAGDDKAICFTVSEDAAGQPLAALVAAQVGSDSASRVLTRGGVWLNKHRALDGRVPVAAGTQVIIHTPPGGHYSDLQIGAADVLYEDGWLLALNKRPGWYTTPTPWDAYSNIREALGRFLHQRNGTPPVLHLVHQLDRDTSGVLLCTTHPAANAPLQVAFDEGSVSKTYLCLCAGVPATDSFEVRSGHGRGRNGIWRLYREDEIGNTLPNGSRVRLAHTSFFVEQRLKDVALLRAVLHTGRTHQVRLHLASLGHPLLGDGRYGGPLEVAGLPVQRHLLHAASLQLRHPITGRPLDLQAALPEQMRQILALADGAG